MRTCRRPGLWAALLLSALLLSACGTPAAQDTPASRSGTTGEVAPATSPAAPQPSPGSAGSGTDPAGSSAGRIQDPTSTPDGDGEVALPTRVRIPAIGVDAPLETLAVDAANVLQPPVAWEAAGWYDRSPVPGERGPSVIAGHLVAPDGPAVFVDLGALVPGDLVEVERADGTLATFAVDRTISAERSDSFPTEEIYGPTPDAQLRLITCDGEYDPARGHWTRNMVVFASEVTR